MANKKIIKEENIEVTEQVNAVAETENQKPEIHKKNNVFKKAAAKVKTIPDMTVKEFGKKIVAPVAIVGGVITAGVVAINKAKNSEDEISDDDYEVDVVVEIDEDGTTVINE